ncbi:DUF6879 family protein [Streptacidiphilus fuscans]|uniref:DUF6879 domain-containing protein n=1 Tax=Streptacidiphilus fuscans TaxID=2789292 RepID=A0A931FED7_9ACTN|nr:DUF6879 family protein [Streptacidiphilus fuscans]MBF9068541.1 hypothetical protein [Streptacidiphilus fuscans]
MLVPFAEISNRFTDFEHTAWRLESRKQYATDLESPRFAAFRETGRLPDQPGHHAWVANVLRQLDQGKTFGRVRILDEPLTDNQRFLLASSLESPEDIRVLTRSKAKGLELPDEDVWIFDSKTIARLVFDDQDRTLGVEITENAAEVLRVCQIRDAARHFAVPAREFAAALPSEA